MRGHAPLEVREAGLGVAQPEHLRERARARPHLPLQLRLVARVLGPIAALPSKDEPGTVGRNALQRIRAKVRSWKQ